MKRQIIKVLGPVLLVFGFLVVTTLSATEGFPTTRPKVDGTHQSQQELTERFPKTPPFRGRPAEFFRGVGPLRRRQTIKTKLVTPSTAVTPFKQVSESRGEITVVRRSPTLIDVGHGSNGKLRSDLQGVNFSDVGTTPGFSVATHRHFLDAKRPFPTISQQNDVWMYSHNAIPILAHGSAKLVNPLNSDAFEQIFELRRLHRQGSSQSAALTRIVARNCIYLGWVVRTDADVRALKTALLDRSRVALNEDIDTPSGVLFRLTPTVAKRFATDPHDENELASIRRTIPVVFEVLNPDVGHPCKIMHVLYLDGHIERIPMGKRFPATETLVKAFPAPSGSGLKQDHSND